ncbi:MAG: hypothetical protein OXI96_05665 [Acidimicrobiaceae bacterium]|nr:hypothetical protein [Acidimicrobiaceae bacterium]
MGIETVVEVVTLLLAVLALVWHQQRNIDKLRGEFQGSFRDLRSELRGEFDESFRDLRGEFKDLRIEFQESRSEFHESLRVLRSELRGEFQGSLSELRGEFQGSLSELRIEFHEFRQEISDAVARNGQQLARIEGYLNIRLVEMPDPPDPRVLGTSNS